MKRAGPVRQPVSIRPETANASATAQPATRNPNPASETGQGSNHRGLSECALRAERPQGLHKLNETAYSTCDRLCGGLLYRCRRIRRRDAHRFRKSGQKCSLHSASSDLVLSVSGDRSAQVLPLVLFAVVRWLTPTQRGIMGQANPPVTGKG